MAVKAGGGVAGAGAGAGVGVGAGVGSRSASRGVASALRLVTCSCVARPATYPPCTSSARSCSSVRIT